MLEFNKNTKLSNKELDIIGKAYQKAYEKKIKQITPNDSDMSYKSQLKVIGLVDNLTYFTDDLLNYPSKISSMQTLERLLEISNDLKLLLEIKKEYTKNKEKAYVIILKNYENIKYLMFNDYKHINLKWDIVNEYSNLSKIIDHTIQKLVDKFNLIVKYD